VLAASAPEDSRTKFGGEIAAAEKKGRHFDTLLSCGQGMRFQAADGAASFAGQLESLRSRGCGKWADG